MSLGKKDIAKDISTKAQISLKKSTLILNKFIDIVKTKSFNGPVKMSNFGTFYPHMSPQRVGRNPKTLEEFTIEERVKILFSASKKIKSLIN